MITYRKTQGRQVVARREGAYVGKLDDFQFDLIRRVIYGYRLKGGGVFGRAGGVSAKILDQIGRDVAFVNAEEDIAWSGASRNAEEGRAWASLYRGTRVMSRLGASIGAVDDLAFDPASRKVVALILDGNRYIELTEQVATGPAAVIVEDTALVRELPQEEHAGQDWWSRVVSSFSSSDDRSEPPKALTEPAPPAVATPESPVEAPAGEAPPSEKPPQ